VVLSLGFHQQCAFVDRIVGTVPVDDDSINATADHVFNLPLHLHRIGRTVTDVHVASSAEPGQQVSVHFRRSSGIQQRVHVHLADIPRPAVTINLIGKGIGSAGIVGCLLG
jgi:hypothetical protein